MRSFFLLLLPLLCSAALAAPGDAPRHPARLVQGTFHSASDQQAFQNALAKSFGGEIRISPESVASGDGAEFDRFGHSVALSGDTALVGVPFDDTLAGENAGSVYVFTRNGTAWTQQTKLSAADGAERDFFGYSLAFSGDTALVGASFDSSATEISVGSVYVFTRSANVWTQQAKLTASDGAGGDDFGISVALSGDIALVGANRDDMPGAFDVGSAYVFTRSGTVWTQQAKLIAGDGAQYDEFGISVALSGDTALVGSLRGDTPTAMDAGSVYVFARNGAVWTLQTKLTASDGTQNEQFGSSLGLSGDTALVGALADDTPAGPDAGSAFVFTRSGTAWTQQARLTADDGAAGDLFGNSVALSGDTALVGAFFHNSPVSENAGSAYVFTRSGNVWSQQSKLIASDGDRADQFGIAVALSGDTAVVGANFDDTSAGARAGSAHVFTRSGTVWSQQVKLTAGDGGAGDQFGYSVALSGDTALVGANLDDKQAPTDNSTDAGSAVVFIRNGTEWTQQAKLMADDEFGANDWFGNSVALDGDTALVGAVFDDTSTSPDVGSAYVFTRNGSVWSQQAKLTAADGAADDLFGYSVALSGDTALVGARLDDAPGAVDIGSAYVFIRSDAVWTQQAKLTARDGATVDQFGNSVALDGDTALVGAFQPGPQDADVGAAYVFARSGDVWTQQAKLTADDAAYGHLFGHSVALSGDTALVGAVGSNAPTANFAGSAYVFTRSGNVWMHQAKLNAGDAAPGDQFGHSVALVGNTAVVGAPFDDAPTQIDVGSAYVFTRSGTGWTPRVKLTASDGRENDQFGYSVAVSGVTALVGAYLDDSAVSGNADVGSAYLYSDNSMIFWDGFESVP